MAIQLSLKEGADILMGTDPDCDRMGVAVKNPDGGMTLITGNQISADVGRLSDKQAENDGVDSQRRDSVGGLD